MKGCSKRFKDVLKVEFIVVGWYCHEIISFDYFRLRPHEDDCKRKR